MSAIMCPKSELYVIDGDYGLPSFDIECIKSILFTKIAKVPVTMKLRNSVKTCSLYSAPAFIDGKTTLTNFKDIVSFLRGKHFNIDCGLSSKQASALYAMESFVSSKLHPMLAYVLWVEPRNCDELTSAWFMKALPFPFNHAYVKRCKAAAADLMDALYPNEELEAVREFMKKLSSNVLSNLSVWLGSSRFFFGDSPTTMDVLVYAYLSPLIKVKYPCTEITNLIHMWPNLTTFVKRVDAIYFSDITFDVKYLKKKEKVQQNDDDVSYVALFIMITSASSIMFYFALNKGIIKLSS